MTATSGTLRYNKTASTLICAGAYIVAGAAALAAGYLVPGTNVIITALAADCAATVVVFIFSLALNNSSMYDPYWSVAPLPIALYWLAGGSGGGPSPRRIAVIALTAVWGARLTYNWHRQWKGLAHEDWRYVNFRNTTGRLYWAVSFLGIHLYPTLMVFLGCVPLYAVMAGGGAPLGPLDLAAFAVTGGAILVETIADRQLHAFVKSGPGDAILSSGIWAYSRHPNYFGEVCYWWGLFLFSLAAGAFHWWTIAGAAAITVMFAGVSIPLMEKRMLSRRPLFAERRRKVSALVPWFPKK